MFFSSLATGRTFDVEFNFVLYASSSPEAAVSTNQCLREYQLIPISRYRKRFETDIGCCIRCICLTKISKIAMQLQPQLRFKTFVEYSNT
jgi:hypothetical protein